MNVADGNKRWWVLAAMSGVLGLVVFDETVVGVALPTMRAELGLSLVASHWVVNAYLLTFTCFVAIAGRLGDDLGHRAVFLVGLALFGLASLVGGFASNGDWLIAARAAQGVGAAILFPSSWAIMTSTIPPNERGVAFGIQTTVGGIFMSMGPLVGGLLVETLSWRWIFWVNLPVVCAIGAIVLGSVESAHREGRVRRSVDLLGAVLLVTGLVATVLALMEGDGWGWRAPQTLILLIGGIGVLALLILVEARLKNALIEVDLLRIRAFTGGNLVFFMFQFNKIVVFIFGPLYLQHVLQKSPFDAGAVIAVAVLPTLITSIVCGRLIDRIGSRQPLLSGLVINGVALILFGLATMADSFVAVVLPLLVWGATLPFISVAPRRALMSAVPASHQSQASGINLTIQMLGGAIGLAICGAIYAGTGSFSLIFVLTGCVVLAMLPVSWLMIEPAERG